MRRNDPVAGGKLVDAVKARDYKDVQKWLRGGADPNHNNGAALFNAAIVYRNIEIAELLLQNGANPNAYIKLKVNDTTEAPLLVRTIIGSDEAMAKLLLERGANPDGTSAHNGGEPLCEAAGMGHEGIVKLLLDKGANINASNGWALRNAVRNKHKAVAKLLIEKGINVNVREGEAFQMLISEDRKELIDLIDLFLEKKINPSYCAVALCDAAHKKKKDVVLKLINYKVGDEKVDINSQNGRVLIHAAANNWDDVVNILLENGIKLNANNCGNEAIKKANARGHHDMVKLLTEAMQEDKLQAESKPTVLSAEVDSTAATADTSSSSSPSQEEPTEEAAIAGLSLTDASETAATAATYDA
jgi:ankyrin repeat protein